MTRVCGTTIAFALALALGASAQSLGDVARKEEARRKAVAGSGKVYTNGQLRPETTPPAPQQPAPSTPSAAGGPADKSSGAAKSEKPAEKPETNKDQAFWRDRMTKAREAVDRAKAFAEALQSQINGLSAEFTARDDPRQRALVGEKRQKALDELARVNKEIAALEKAVRDIEEEARKSGVPPGWLR